MKQLGSRPDYHDGQWWIDWFGGKDWESVYRSPHSPIDPVFIQE